MAWWQTIFLVVTLPPVSLFKCPWPPVVSVFVYVCVSECDKFYRTDDFLSFVLTLSSLPGWKKTCSWSFSLNSIGQMTSSLYLLLTHYLNVKTQAHNLSVLIEMSKLITLFRLEWAPHNVDWPSVGNFFLAHRKVIEEIVFRHWMGDPNQVSYIVVWRNLMKDSLPGLNPSFLSRLSSWWQQRRGIQCLPYIYVPQIKMPHINKLGSAKQFIDLQFSIGRRGTGRLGKGVSAKIHSAPKLEILQGVNVEEEIFLSPRWSPWFVNPIAGFVSRPAFYFPSFGHPAAGPATSPDSYFPMGLQHSWK